MKIASYRWQGVSSYGRVHDGQVADAGDELRGRFPDLKSLLAGGALDELAGVTDGTSVALDDLEFLPTIPNPDKILCVGINYLAHIKEMGREPPEYPWIFVRFAASQVGHGQPLICPRASQQYDFEGELAVIIGKAARHVSAASALDFVAGYSCFDDGSVRDYQTHGSQFTPGKNFWRSGSFGPWLVTTDEIPDPSRLHLETRVNGERMQATPVSDLVFDIPTLIEYCSTFTELAPGDVIITGTPGGVGAARTPPVWLKAGDTLEVEISSIGTLRNPIVAEG